MTWAEVTALVGIVGGLVIGYLGWRRSVNVDKVSAQSGAESDTRAGTAQIIDALNALIDQLQEDNQSFRADVHLMGSKLEALTQERDELKHELARLRRKYGNGDNGDTPPWGTPKTHP